MDIQESLNGHSGDACGSFRNCLKVIQELPRQLQNIILDLICATSEIEAIELLAECKQNSKNRFRSSSMDIQELPK